MGIRRILSWTSRCLAAGLVGLCSACGGLESRPGDVEDAGPGDGRVLWSIGARGSVLELRGVATTRDGRGALIGDAYSLVWRAGEPEEWEEPFVHSNHGFARFVGDDGSAVEPFLATFAYNCAEGTSPVTDEHHVGVDPEGALAVAGVSHFCPLMSMRSSPCPLTAEGASVFLIRHASDPVWEIEWATTVHSGEGEPIAVAAASDGSAAVAGVFRGAATFAPCRPGEVSLEAGEGGARYVATFDSAGELSWLWTDPAMSSLRLAFLEGDGDLLVAGTFSGSLALGSGGETMLRSSGGSDLFVARFGRDGSLRWARRGGGAGTDGARAVAGGPRGTVAVAGSIEGEASFDGGTAEDGSVSSAGAADATVALYDGEGALLWALAVGGLGDDRAEGVAVTPEGRVALCGGFHGEATVGSTETVLSSAGGRDGFVLLVDADGEPIWATSAGGEGDDAAQDVAAFPDGSLLVAGPLGGTAEIGPSELEGSEVFLARLR